MVITCARYGRLVVLAGSVRGDVKPAKGLQKETLGTRSATEGCTAQSMTLMPAVVLQPIVSATINTNIMLQACTGAFACRELSLNYIKKDVLTGNPRSVEFLPHPTLDPQQTSSYSATQTHSDKSQAGTEQSSHARHSGSVK